MKYQKIYINQHEISRLFIFVNQILLPAWRYLSLTHHNNALTMNSETIQKAKIQEQYLKYPDEILDADIWHQENYYQKYWIEWFKILFNTRHPKLKQNFRKFFLSKNISLDTFFDYISYIQDSPFDANTGEILFSQEVFENTYKNHNIWQNPQYTDTQKHQYATVCAIESAIINS